MARWETPVKRFLFRLVGNTAEAEDLAQDVFVRIFTKRASYRPGAKFSTWCFSIAANLAKNRLRWWNRRPSLSLDAWMDSGGDAADPTDTGQAATELLRRERVAAVQSAVASLPLSLRTTLVLFEYEHLAMSDIAVTQNCTTKAVENRLFRARRKLHEHLSKAAVR